MPQGEGTYGTKKGRPSKADKRTYANKATGKSDAAKRAQKLYDSAPKRMPSMKASKPMGSMTQAERAQNRPKGEKPSWMTQGQWDHQMGLIEEGNKKVKDAKS